MLRRLFIAGLALISLAGIGRGIAVPGIGGSSPTALTSFTLINTSASIVSTVVSPFIGLQFKKGDIAANGWPSFSRHDNSQACVYSQGLRRNWSDTSLKHLSVVVRCPGTIAGNGSLQVDVSSGGSQPAASSRTTAEESAANISMIAVGSVNLSGTWTATLADAITNGVCNAWIDGDAGKGWICDGDYKQSAVAQGELRARWYTFSITDGSGALGGIRYLSRTWQPYYDADAITAKNMRAFSTLETCTGTTSTTCSGGTATAVSWPYSNVSFTWNSGNSFTATGNNFATGSQDTDVVPVTLTTTGALPTGLSTGTVYYAQVAGSGSAGVSLFTNSNASGSASASGAGSGTNTLVPTLAVQQFGSIYNATPSATFNYVQGGGSLTADATVRFTKDATYWHATKVLPPWNTTIAAAVPTWSFNWNPVTIGPMVQSIPQTGPSTQIGPTPAQDVLHFFTQDVNGELVIRTIGLAGVDMNVGIRQCAVVTGACTKFAPPNVGDPGNAYTGFGTNAASTFVFAQPDLGGNSFPVGSLPPTTNATTTWSGADFSHIPSLAYYPYLWSGEPQYLDEIEEIANNAIFDDLADNVHRNPAIPPGLSTQKFAVVTGLPGQTRQGAWQLRDVVHAAGITPDTSPDGIAWKSYFVDSATASLAWLNTTITNTSTYASTNGYHAFRSFAANAGAGFTRNDNAPFQEAYLMMAAEYGWALLESTDAATFINNKAIWFTHQTANMGDWQSYGFYDLPVHDDAAQTPINADTQWGGSLSATTISWSSSTNLFTIDNNISTGGNYVPAVDDQYIFPDASYCISSSGVCGVLPGGLTAMTPYYVCNPLHVSGTIYTFKLANTKGSGCGTTMTITNTASGDPEATYTSAVVAGQPSTGAASGGTSIDGFVAEFQAAGFWAQALGQGSNINHKVTDATARLTGFTCATATSVEFGCMQASY